MLLFLIDLINIEIFRISFNFFYSFSFILCKPWRWFWKWSSRSTLWPRPLSMGLGSPFIPGSGYLIGRLLLPFPSPKCIWLVVRFIAVRHSALPFAFSEVFLWLRVIKLRFYFESGKYKERKEII